jgi:hypothetical protein
MPISAVGDFGSVAAHTPDVALRIRQPLIAASKTAEIWPESYYGNSTNIEYY